VNGTSFTIHGKTARKVQPSYICDEDLSGRMRVITNMLILGEQMIRDRSHWKDLIKMAI
jgi:hypothetical protein